MDISKFNKEHVFSRIPDIFELARASRTVSDFRGGLSLYAFEREYYIFDNYEGVSEGSIIRVRDCARAINRILTRRSESKAKFSFARAIFDLAHEKVRDDLTPAFYAELLHLFLGLEGRGPGRSLVEAYLAPTTRRGRNAAVERSKQLDILSGEKERRIGKICDGLQDESVARRRERAAKIWSALNGTEEEWNSWEWQVRNILRDYGKISELVGLSEREKGAIKLARENSLPFGITPYYLSLMDETPGFDRDRAVRAQVIPEPGYVQKLEDMGTDNSCLDFMRETDTSPVGLITRRYPEICIFKPFNTCPQICVYCQRNWEIRDAMEPGALAGEAEIEKALSWIRDHPMIHEVLMTGGDPLGMQDDIIENLMERLAGIPAIERIRIGSRVPVTMPMRITERLSDILARFRKPGRRQVALVTHIQHPYEITPDTVAAVERLRSRGIPVYNQLVYTFFISRRFEAARLRRLLHLIGVDPYYTFNTKGKEETMGYRVPIARLLQEQKEEARLLPGLSRTDEAVFNVPGLGKNYLRGAQHRDLISVLPNGARLYEFHSWEKKISSRLTTHISEDVPILDYLQRLKDIGEDPADYETIWYYF